MIRVEPWCGVCQAYVRINKMWECVTCERPVPLYTKKGYRLVLDYTISPQTPSGVSAGESYIRGLWDPGLCSSTSTGKSGAIGSATPVIGNTSPGRSWSTR